MHNVYLLMLMFLIIIISPLIISFFQEGMENKKKKNCHKKGHKHGHYHKKGHKHGHYHKKYNKDDKKKDKDDCDCKVQKMTLNTSFIIVMKSSFQVPETKSGQNFAIIVLLTLIVKARHSAKFIPTCKGVLENVAITLASYISQMIRNQLMIRKMLIIASMSN